MKNETISERIKFALDKSSLTQAEVVKKTGISKGALSSYIAGRYVPKQTNIYKLAKALNVSPAWLMGLDVPMVDNKKLESDNTKSNTIVDLIEKVNFLDIEDKKFLKYFLNEKEKNYILGTETKKILSKISKELNLDYKIIEDIFINFKSKQDKQTELNYDNVRKIIINALEKENKKLN